MSDRDSGKYYSNISELQVHHDRLRLTYSQLELVHFHLLDVSKTMKSRLEWIFYSKQMPSDGMIVEVYFQTQEGFDYILVGKFHEDDPHSDLEYYACGKGLP